MAKKVTKSHIREVKDTLELLRTGVPIICFDLETTGFSSTSDRILSCSAIKYVLTDGIFKEIERMDLFMNPGFHIPDKVTEINHISDERVASCPMEDEAINEITAFFGDNPLVCGYNSISFDQKFLSAMYNRTLGTDFSPICHCDVLSMAREKMDLPKYNLGIVAHELGADIGLEFHNSLDDVIATFRCFELLVKEYENDEVKPLPSVVVNEVNYWKGPKHTLQRVYVNTSPRTSTYYDVYKSAWISSEDIDLDKLRADVLALESVTDEKALVKKLTA